MLKVDKSGLKKLKAVFNSDLALKVGFFEESVYEDGIQVAQVAQWNEEGTSTNPMRPFMRVGFGSAISKGVYHSIFVDSIESIIMGKSTFAKEYQKLGPMVVADMQEEIEEWNTPPNSPRTVERKGFNNPLIDTGLMHDSVKFRVEKE